MVSEARKKLGENTYTHDIHRAVRSIDKDKGLTTEESSIEDMKAKEKVIQERIKRKKEAIKQERNTIVKAVINDIDARRGDEARDASTYFKLALKYKSIPTASKIFQELSEAEDNHKNRLTQLAKALQIQT